MIFEEEAVTEADIVVLPPSKVDEQSDCDAVDENELTSGDAFPTDVAGLIEVQYEADKITPECSGKFDKGKRKRATEVQQYLRKSDRTRKGNTRYMDGHDDQSKRKHAKKEMEENVSIEADTEELQKDDAEEAAEPCSKVTKTKSSRAKSETPTVQWTKQKP